jgi:hypothetical protein
MQQEYEEMQQLQQKQMLREQKHQLRQQDNGQQQGYPSGQGQYSSSNAGYPPQQGQAPAAGNTRTCPLSALTIHPSAASGGDANTFMFLGFIGLVAAGFYIKQNPQPSEGGYANIAPEPSSQPQL